MKISQLNFGFSKKQWILFALFGFSHLCAGLGWSLPAPFYPKLAASKGVSTSIYGFVFGIFELVNFLSAPLLGKNIRRIGSSCMFKTGIFVMGAACICFGYLDKIPNEYRTIFIVLSFVIRIVEALGQTAFFIATFAICAQLFHDKVSIVFSFLEAMSGLGSIIGPAVGGFLYEILGYVGPFAVMGGCLLTMTIISLFVLSKSEAITETPPSFWKILSILGIIISFLANVAANFSVGFNSTLLEPAIQQFNLAPSTSSLVFTIQGGVYALTINFWGIAARKVHPKIFCGVGGIFISVGFLLLGPAPFLPVKPTIWLMVIALVLQGLGVAAVAVSTFVDCNQEALANGYPDTIETYGIVSGLWTASFALGLFSGSTASGILNDVLGFRNATLVVLALNMLLMTLSFCKFFSKWKPVNKL